MKSEKITEAIAGARWYDDACGTAHALELVGERWSLLIVRELMFGPRRFSELRRTLPGISANVLTQRLAGLERAHILHRHVLPSPANVAVYELTAWGYEAEEPIKVLGGWAARSPDHDPSLPLSAASLMLSFRTMAPAGASLGAPARLGFDLGAADRFVVTVADGTLTAARDDPATAAVRFAGPPEALAALVYGKAPAAALPGLAISGDAALAQRFVDLFALPPKASIAPGRAAE